jgi:hypothetical protein
MDSSREARPPAPSDEEVVLLEDLAPRREVGGGRKITLGERVPDGPLPGTAGGAAASGA